MLHTLGAAARHCIIAEQELQETDLSLETHLLLFCLQSNFLCAARLCPSSGLSAPADVLCVAGGHLFCVPTLTPV